MASVAGVLEALVLLPVDGCVPQLPKGLPVAELSIEGARLIPITDAVHAQFEVAEGSSDKVAGFRELTTALLTGPRTCHVTGRCCMCIASSGLETGSMPPSPGLRGP